MKHARFGLILPLIAALAALAGCGEDGRDPVASVENAWVRLPAAPGLPAAGYFAADLSSPRDAIVAVTSPSAQRIEMHQSVSERGVSRMVPVERVGREGVEAIRFEPGGRHLMIHGLDPALRPTDQIELNFRFAQAPPVSVRARVAQAGEMEVGEMGHGH